MIPLLLGLLAGCGAPEPDWTLAGSVAPTLAALDADGDGRLGPGEYAASSYHAPPFSEADVDGDGGLDAEELLILLARQDPLDFDRAPPPIPSDVDQREAPGARTQSQQEVWELLVFLRAEVAAARPGLAEAPDGLPTLAEIRDAAAPGDLAAPRARAMLRRLQRAHAEAGLRFPEGLLPQAP